MHGVSRDCHAFHLAFSKSKGEINATHHSPTTQQKVNKKL